MTTKNIAKTINLDYEVTVSGQKFTALDLRRPKGKDLKVLSRPGLSETDAEYAFFAQLAEVPPGVFDEMDMDDIKKVQDWFKDFLSATSS